MGRRIKSMTLAEATTIRTKRGSRSLRCWKCPKWLHGFCTILAKVMVAAHPCCAYGKTLMHMEKMQKRRKGEKK